MADLPVTQASAPLGLILAGGGGRRMGGADKALVTLAGRPLVSHVQARLAPQVAGCAISANGDPGRLDFACLTVLPDPPPGDQGPLAGVLAGLDWAAGQGAAALVTVAVDTPFVPLDLVRRLAGAARGMGAPLAVATAPDDTGQVRTHPACALWPVALRDDLRAALRQGVRRLGAWAEEMGARQAFFADGTRGFYNVNRPEDLARAEALIASGP